MLKSTHALKKYSRTLLVLALIIGLNPHFVFAISYSIPSGFSFQTNLKQGDTVDPDVKYLQSILNSKSETKVADSGPGSASQPTSYFGALTKAAVMRFQELYKTEVLLPAGLTTPTGTVGLFTRNKLNALIQQNNVPVTSTLTTSTTGPTAGLKDLMGIITALPNTKLLDTSQFSKDTTATGVDFFALPKNSLSGTSSNNLTITGLSTYQTKPGLVMSIFGTGFGDTLNTIYLGPVYIGKYSANTSGTLVTFTIPEYIPRGFYQVSVSNKYGTTTRQNLFLYVDRPLSADVVDTKPTIHQITPTYTQYPNDLIVITGQNFTLQNRILTNLGDIPGVISPDGKKVSFFVGTLPHFYKAQKEYLGSSINLIVKVANENGTSTDSINHIIKFPLTTNAVNSTVQSDALNSLYPAQAVSTTTSSNSTSTTGTYPNMYYTYTNASGGAEYPQTSSPSSASSNSSTQQSQTSSNSGNSSSNIGGAAATLGLAGLAGSLGSSVATGPKVVDYFGGKIIATIPCTCSGQTLVTVDDYATKSAVVMLYNPAISKLNMNFNIWSVGVYVIGGLLPVGGVCSVYAGTGCTVVGAAPVTIDTFRGVGTSPY